jgi:hypothetical protein
MTLTSFLNVALLSHMPYGYRSAKHQQKTTYNTEYRSPIALCIHCVQLRDPYLINHCSKGMKKCTECALWLIFLLSQPTSPTFLTIPQVVPNNELAHHCLTLLDLRRYSWSVFPKIFAFVINNVPPPKDSLNKICSILTVQQTQSCGIILPKNCKGQWNFLSVKT